MKRINIQEAKTHLSRLVEDAMAGEEVVIAKAGRPCVRLVPYASETTPRRLGGLEGRIWIADDFDEESAEIVALFAGEPTPKVKRSARKAGARRR